MAGREAAWLLVVPPLGRGATRHAPAETLPCWPWSPLRAGYLSVMAKHTPMDDAAKAWIMSAAARNPDSDTAQDGFDRRAQSAADQNADEEEDDQIQ